MQYLSNMKVSFDFDETLDQPHIQEYAKELIERGIEVHVLTTRYEDINNYPIYKDNKNYFKEMQKSLFSVAEKVGIKKKNIHFTNMDWKAAWLIHNPYDFIWHLDDYHKECDNLNAFTETIGICHLGGGSWINKCNKLLNAKK